MQDHYLGIDVGGTKTEVCLLALNRASDFHTYTVRGRERMKTDRTSTLPDFLSRLQVLVKSVLKSQNLNMSDIRGIGIGLPGSIDPKTTIMQAGSITYFHDVPLKEHFQAALEFKGPLVFDNDANCFALAETYFGAGADWAQKNNMKVDELCVVGLIVGTGVGGGLVVRGEMLRGRRGGAGEIGHVTYIPGGHACYCGKHGCAEQYLSGTAFEAAFAARTPGQPPLKGSEIFKRVEQGDPVAKATLEEYREHLVNFLSTISNFFDPHVIVLGGGMSLQPAIYEGMSDQLSKACFLTKSPPAVVPHQAGDSAGVIGAALLSFAERKHAASGSHSGTA